jgi:uncharacterized protein
MRYIKEFTGLHMKRYVSYSRNFIFLLIVVLHSGFLPNHALAKANEIPKSIGYVNDFYGLLEREQIHQLTTILKDLEKTVGSQMVILIIDSTKGETIEDYSLRVANAWGIGRKDYDDGVLITVAVKDRRLRIEVGLGLEKIIPNDLAKNIIKKNIVPYFKKDEFYWGLLNGTKRIIKIIKENKNNIGAR